MGPEYHNSVVLHTRRVDSPRADYVEIRFTGASDATQLRTATMKYAIIRALVCLVLIASTVACGGLTKDIESVSEADPKVDFSGMKSYGWIGAAGVVTDPQNLWTAPSFDVAAELKFHVDSELRKKGYVESGNPDMAVAMLIVNDVRQLEVIASKRKGSMPDMVGVGVGAILIEIVDVKSGKTIWLGAASGETKTNRTEEEMKKRLAYAVKQLLKQLPK